MSNPVVDKVCKDIDKIFGDRSVDVGSTKVRLETIKEHIQEKLDALRDVPRAEE